MDSWKNVGRKLAERTFARLLKDEIEQTSAEDNGLNMHRLCNMRKTPTAMLCLTNET